MFKPLIVLLAVSGLGLGIAFLLPGEQNRVPAILGLAIVLPPAMFSMLAVGTIAKRWPQLGVTVIVAGTGLRLGWAVVAVAALGNKVERWNTTPEALANGTTAYYLLLLATETVLLWRMIDGGHARSSGSQTGRR